MPSYKMVTWNTALIKRSTDGVTFDADVAVAVSYSLAWFDEYDATLNYGLAVRSSDRQTVDETLDGGTTWASLATILPEDFTDGGTAAQGSIIRTGTGTIIATLINTGTGLRITRSTDHGATWSAPIIIDGGAPRQGEWYTFRRLPTGTLLLHTGNGAVPFRIWRSTTDGVTWTNVFSNADAFGGALTMLSHAYMLRDLVTGLELRRSTDDGVTWPVVLSNGFRCYDTNAKYRSNPALCPDNSLLLHCYDTGTATAHHFRSTDSGATWVEEAVPASFPAGPKSGELVGVGGTSGTVLFVDRTGGNVVQQSLDNGLSWFSPAANSAQVAFALAPGGFVLPPAGKRIRVAPPGDDQRKDDYRPIVRIY